MTSRIVWGSGGAAVPSPMVTTVAAAARVPSSLTSTNVFWSTSLMKSGPSSPRPMREKSASSGSKASVMPSAWSASESSAS